MYEWNNNNSTPNNNLTPSYPYYQPQGSSQPPEPELPKKEKKGRSKKLGYAASLVAVAVFAGAAGGGTTFYLMSDSLTAPAAVQAEITSEPEAAQAVELPQSNSGSGANDIAAIVAKASNSVVEISTTVSVQSPFFGQMESTGSGSGVILTEDGYIVTNDHVVEDASAITVRTADGEEYSAALIGTDSSTDLAVLKIDASGLSAVTFADSDSIEVGQLAVAIGNPLGTLGGTVTDGIISAKDREVTIDGTTMTLLQTSAAVNPGNSGGGLFDGDGNLVGVVNAKSSGDSVEGLGFAIPSNLVQKVAFDFIDNGYITGRPEIGISVVEIRDLRTARAYGLGEPGIYVANVSRDNGLEQGDMILSINGWELESSSDLKSLLSEASVGDTWEIAIKRGGAQQTVTITLQEQVPEEIRQELPVEAEL